ncbi:MAG TPA: GH25 family lysozyme [Rhizorhapis sp.]|nr:GH25 family lysozyme [Rhizorhapis sp.]
MARRTWKRRLIFMALWLVLISAAAWGAMRYAQGWTPSREAYPVQGITIAATNGPAEWRTLRAEGADFTYLRATSGASARDRAFETNLAGAREAGLRYGALHHYSLCSPASEQATLFIATVPRDPAMLPPAVGLDLTPDCGKRPGRAAVLSELNTFLNLIEAHSGKPALIRVSPEFEDLYKVAEGVNRTLWLEGNFISPDYAGRPWVVWTASNIRRIDGIDTGVEWDVVRS